MPRASRASSFLALFLCATVAASCGDDPFSIRAPFVTVSDSFAISALTRTPASSRSLWRIGTFERFRIDSVGSQFDLGLDIDAGGRLLVVPARRIAVPPPGTVASPPVVGLQVSSAAYASADRAPENGYIVDTALVVTKGQTVFVRTASNACATQNTGGTQLFAKFVIDSINTTTRVLLVRATFQPSCNFRSFATGIPTF